MNAFRTTPHARFRGGFSLVEVSLALVVAAGGLLAIFGVFPISLRQSAHSRSDMGEMTFGTTVLETISGNIRTIDRISVWNDPERFWDVAVGRKKNSDETVSGLPIFDDGIPSKKMNAWWKSVHGKAGGNLSGFDSANIAPVTTDVAENWSSQSVAEMTDPEWVQDFEGENIWYFCMEKEERPTVSKENIALPPQYLIRLAVVRRYAMCDGSVMKAPDIKNANKQKEVLLPNVYIVSVVSTDRGYPDVYIREPLYSQEFSFIHRP